MKKSILSLLFVIAGLTAKAQVDLSINPFFLLIPGVQASLEYTTKNDWGFGGDVFAGEGAYFIYATGKYYFNPSKGGDKFNAGAYVGGAGIDGDSGYGLGFYVGYKALSTKKILFDVALGGGRDFSDNIGFLPYIKANVGYRFGLKEID